MDKMTNASGSEEQAATPATEPRWHWYSGKVAMVIYGVDPYDHQKQLVQDEVAVYLNALEAELDQQRQRADKSAAHEREVEGELQFYLQRNEALLVEVSEQRQRAEAQAAAAVALLEAGQNLRMAAAHRHESHVMELNYQHAIKEWDKAAIAQAEAAGVNRALES